MIPENESLMKDVEESLLKYGTVSILFYKMEDDWILHKWGSYDKLSAIHDRLFNRYREAGFHDEANSLTLMELPQDPDVICKILSGISLKDELAKIGYTLE